MDGSVDSRSVVQENNDYARYVVEQSPGPVSVPPGPVSVPSVQVLVSRFVCMCVYVCVRVCKAYV